MSSAQVWLTRELSDHIRSVLDPMVEHYSGMASEIGSDPDRQTERAHHVGRAQGLIDAMRALSVAVSVPETRPEPGQVTADVLRRMRQNAGKNAGPRHRAQP